MDLLTGDRPLRKAADKEGVPAHGIIWVYDPLKSQKKMTDGEYSRAIGELMDAVKNGRCRLPIAELLQRL